LLQISCPKRNAGKQLQYIHVLCDFELIKFMCFGSTLSYPHKELLVPRWPSTCTKYNPLPPRNKFNPRPPARVAVQVPAPARQMRVSATRAG